MYSIQNGLHSLLYTKSSPPSVCFTLKAHLFVLATFQVLHSHMGLMAAGVDTQV